MVAAKSGSPYMPEVQIAVLGQAKEGKEKMKITVEKTAGILINIGIKDENTTIRLPTMNQPEADEFACDLAEVLFQLCPEDNVFDEWLDRVLKKAGIK